MGAKKLNDGLIAYGTYVVKAKSGTVFGFQIDLLVQIFSRFCGKPCITGVIVVL